MGNFLGELGTNSMKRYPDMFNNRKKKQQFLAEIERHQEILHSLCRAFFQGEQDREDARQESH